MDGGKNITRAAIGLWVSIGFAIILHLAGELK